VLLVTVPPETFSRSIPVPLLPRPSTEPSVKVFPLTLLLEIAASPVPQASTPFWAIWFVSPSPVIVLPEIVHVVPGSSQAMPFLLYPPVNGV
jgi:hypothetical protein